MGRPCLVKVGNRYNKLLVLERIGSRKQDKVKKCYWKCKCDCGKELEIHSTSLTNGNSKSCGCSRNRPSFRYSGYKDLSGVFWRTIVKRAGERGIEFDANLTKEILYNILDKQNFKCALSGLPITLHRNYKEQRISQTASLDRIDSNKGYSEDNIQWVHKKINYMKNVLDELEFIELCKLVASKNKDPSLFT